MFACGELGCMKLFISFNNHKRITWNVLKFLKQWLSFYLQSQPIMKRADPATPVVPNYHGEIAGFVYRTNQPLDDVQ